MAKQGASDLHLKAASPPHLRLRSEIVPARGEALSGERIAAMVHEVLDPEQQDYLNHNGSIDIAEELDGGDRFRINIYRQRGELSVAVRRVSATIPSFEDLHLPASIEKLTEHHAGLVLVAGMTGAGKSTTIAAMLERINRTRACHIVTIEDPIEYLYTDKKALVDQREIGIDVPDFDLALRSLFREDPDVVLIGEMRDRETFQAALQASETGHLVFGTVHASSAASTINRILELFDKDARPQARQALSFNLRAIICQRLLPCLVEGIDRVPAVEIMLNNPSVRQLIEEGRDAELQEVIRSAEHEGMIDYNQSLLGLIERDYIDPRAAFDAAVNPDELKMMLRGINASQVGRLGR
jgi:twitching motility protein PilT